MLTISELSRRGRESLRGNWVEASVAVLAVGILMSAPNVAFNIFTQLFYYTSYSNSGAVAWDHAVFITITVFGLGLLCLLWLVFVSEPLRYGLAVAFLNMVRKGRFDFSDFMSAKKNYLHVVGTILLPDICVSACMIVALIAGMILSSPVLFSDDSGIMLYDILFGLGICMYIAGFVSVIVLSCAFALIPFIAYDNPEKSAVEVMRMSCRMMKGHKLHLFLFGLSFIGWYIVGCLALLIGLYPVSAYVYSSLVHFYESVKEEKSFAESSTIG